MRRTYRSSRTVTLECLESRLVPGDTVLAGVLVRPLLPVGESFLTTFSRPAATPASPVFTPTPNQAAVHNHARPDARTEAVFQELFADAETWDVFAPRPNVGRGMAGRRPGFLQAESEARPAAGPAALGDGGGHLGYGGAATPIANSLVVEFDTYFDRGLGDPNGNHLSVHSRGPLPNSAHESASLGSTTAIPNMKDGNVHVARVRYAPGELDVFLDDLETPRLSVAVNLEETLNLTRGYAWVGFTSATGSYWERHDVLSWSFTSCGG